MSPTPTVVPEPIWRGWEARHHDRIDAVTLDHLERRRRGEAHPVRDFLFTYYRTSVATTRRWHPGPGLLLEGAERTERRQWRHYRPAEVSGRAGLVVDAESVLARRGRTLAETRRVLAATLARPGSTSCFGLHEWAMLYRTSDEEVRHRSVPLRVGHDVIDREVSARGVRCTHFDAFRFFTDEAVPLNAEHLDREGRAEHEQPACLHAGMDLYAAALSLEAGGPGELVADALDAAVEAREVDMRSSPYDLGAWGLEPIGVETASGRAEYAAFQRGWIVRTNALRRRILSALEALDRWSDSGQPSSGRAPQERTATSATSRPSSA